MFSHKCWGLYPVRPESLPESQSASLSPSIWPGLKCDLRWGSLTCTPWNMNEVTELRNHCQKGTREEEGVRGGETWESRRGEKAHIISPSLDLLVQLVLVLIPERRVAHQQDVEDHPWDAHKTHMDAHKHTQTNKQKMHILLENVLWCVCLFFVRVQSSRKCHMCVKCVN